MKRKKNFPVSYTLTSLAVIVEINAWYTTIVTNPAQVCTEEEMIANFVLYGLFVIGWFIVIVVFFISRIVVKQMMKGKRKNPSNAM